MDILIKKIIESIKEILIKPLVMLNFFRVGLKVILLSILLYAITPTNMNNSIISKKLGFNPSIGTKYIYEINSISKTMPHANLMSKLMGNTYINFSYEIVDKKNNEYNILIKIISYRVNLGIDENKEENYYLKNPYEMLMDGVYFSLVLSGNGKIKNLNGYDLLVNKYDSFNIQHELVKNNVKSVSPPKLEYFTTVFKTVSEMLPDSLVSTNSYWNILEPSMMGEGYFDNTHVNFYNIVADVALMKTQSFIERKAGQATNNFLLEGNALGVLEIDYKTGMPMLYEKKAILKGSIEIGGINIPLEFTSIYVLKGKMI